MITDYPDLGQGYGFKNRYTFMIMDYPDLGPGDRLKTGTLVKTHT